MMKPHHLIRNQDDTRLAEFELSNFFINLERCHHLKMEDESEIYAYRVDRTRLYADGDGC